MVVAAAACPPQGEAAEGQVVQVEDDLVTLLLRLAQHPHGIGLDDLQSVSEEVSAILDAEDPVNSPYTLEVSSPGLDRPLRGEADYRRFLGRLARISSYEPVDGRRHWTGRLLSVEEGVVSLALQHESGAQARIPLDKIAHGRLEVEFPKAEGRGRA